MRGISATIAAVVISVSHAALAQNLPRADEDAAPAAMQATQAEEAGHPVAVAGDAQTAEELVAGLPEAPIVEPGDSQPTAAEIVAQLPERPVAMPAAPTAEEIVAQLPSRRIVIKKVKAPTAQEIVAGLPERPVAHAPTAREIVAGLPERPVVHAPTAQEIVAQLPERLAPDEVAEVVPDDTEVVEIAESEKVHRQPEAMKDGMHDQPGEIEIEMPADPRYGSLDEPQLGTTMDMPRAVLPVPDGHAHKTVGRRWKSKDGRARVAVWTEKRKGGHDTPQRYMRRTFDFPPASVSYQRFTANFAVVSGLFGTRVYYIRCNLSQRTGAFHCFDLAYPVREKQAWEPVVTRMSRTLREARGYDDTRGPGAEAVDDGPAPYPYRPTGL